MPYGASIGDCLLYKSSLTFLFVFFPLNVFDTSCEIRALLIRGLQESYCQNRKKKKHFIQNWFGQSDSCNLQRSKKTNKKLHFLHISCCVKLHNCSPSQSGIKHVFDMLQQGWVSPMCFTNSTPPSYHINSIPLVTTETVLPLVTTEMASEWEEPRFQTRMAFPFDIMFTLAIGWWYCNTQGHYDAYSVPASIAR